MRRSTVSAGLIAFGLVIAIDGVASESPSTTGNQREGFGTVLEISPAESRASFPGSADSFTGTVAVDMLFQPNETRNVSAATVEFAPGARTAWHSHPAGQTLVVTSGTGWIHVWGGERQVMREGDVVWIPAWTKHWHGATDAAPLTHIAIQEQRDGQVVQWLEPVSDEQYRDAGTDH